MAKTATLIILCLYPLPSLNNVKKRLAKVASSYVMALQHCIGEEDEF